MYGIYLILEYRHTSVFLLVNKVSSEKILIIGGSAIENEIETKQTSNVFMFYFAGHKTVR